MLIEVTRVDIETKPTPKGSYCVANVTYIGDGKTKSKKVVSYGASAPAYNILAEAKAGEVFEVGADDTKYFNWISAVRSDGTVAKPASTVTAKVNPARSNYETEEERARRQIYIVRQSSVSSAIEFLKATEPKGLSLGVEDVIKTAKEIESYVLTINPFDTLKDDKID